MSDDELTIPEPPAPDPLNPRERNVFRAVTIEGRARVQVARLFGLRPQDVDAIVRRGHEAMSGHVAFRERRWLKTLRLYRLEFLWQETLAAWYRSQEHEETHRATHVDQKPAKVELARKTQVGDIRFLDLARRLLAEIETVNGELADEFERTAGDKFDVTPDSPDDRIVAFAQYLQLVIDRRRVSEIIDPFGGGASEEPGG